MQFIKYRLRFYGEGRSHCHTILVRDIPPAYASADALLKFMRAVYEDDVLETVVVINADELRKFIAARDKVQCMHSMSMPKDL